MFVMQIVGIELNGEERGKLERNEGFREERERERERGTRREERAAARRRNKWREKRRKRALMGRG